MLVNRIRNQKDRRGAVAVEFAVVLPVFMVLVLGTIEVGRALEVSQMMLIAVREGARLGATDYAKSDSELKATNANVNSDIRNFLRAAEVPIDSLVIEITNAETDAAITLEDYPDTVTEPRLYRIAVRLPFSTVSYATPFFLAGQNLEQSIVMREGHD